MRPVVPHVLVPVHRWLARHPCIHRILVRIVRIYNWIVGERRVGAAMQRLVEPGDCVWDIGANVGVYTKEFLGLVGPTGRVVAIEPVPSHIEQLYGLADSDQLTIVPAALASSDGEMSFVVNGEESHIGDGPDAVQVRVARGDALLDEGIPVPHVLKIDVEGFEGDVLDGMPTALATVRGLIMEVHFAALVRRDRPSDPERIVDLLRGSGFDVRWLDSSHLIAERPRAA